MQRQLTEHEAGTALLVLEASVGNVAARNAMDDLASSLDGWLIKRTATHTIRIRTRSRGYRLSLCRGDAAEPERYWSYLPRPGDDGFTAFLAAVAAALAWDPDTEHEPVGWNRNGQTGEYRSKGRFV